MWLSGPVYESLPYCYLLGGGLFAGGTLYIGLDAPGAYLYLACSLISFLYGAVIIVLRQLYRAAMERPDNAETA